MICPPSHGWYGVALWSRKGPSGTWGSTAATILSLQALVWAAGGATHKGLTPFTILVKGKEVKQGEVTEANAAMLQRFDCNEHLRPVVNEVTLKVKGETNLMSPIVGRHFEPWRQEAPKKVLLEVAVEYDRTKLSTADLLRVKATLKYNGEVPAYLRSEPKSPWNAASGPNCGLSGRSHSRDQRGIGGDASISGWSPPGPLIDELSGE
jgi:hypothetical protein